MTKQRVSITQDRWIKPARVTKDIKTWAENIGVRIYRAKVGDASKIGVHVLEAEQFELERALEKAERDNFPAIYLHTFRTWRVDKPAKRPKFKPLELIQGGISIQL